MNNLEIGQRIRKQRELLGLTREELAEKLDISTKFCYDIELGAKGMSVETLCKMSAELMLSTDYILFGKTNNNEKDEELELLISYCDKEKAEYLKNIIRNFIKATKE